MFENLTDANVDTVEVELEEATLEAGVDVPDNVNFFANQNIVIEAEDRLVSENEKGKNKIFLFLIFNYLYNVCI